MDCHFGHCEWLDIYERAEGGPWRRVEIRAVPPCCSGPARCLDGVENLGEAIRRLGDCRAVFSLRMGPEPSRRFRAAGIDVIETLGPIEEALAKYDRVGVTPGQANGQKTRNQVGKEEGECSLEDTSSRW